MEPRLKELLEIVLEFAADPHSDMVFTEAKELIEAVHDLQETIVLLRGALVGLVGSDDKEELEKMEVFLRVSPAPMEDKASTIDAIHAIVKTAHRGKG